MMQVFEFVIVIVVVSLVAGVLNNWIKHRSRAPKIDEELEQRLQRISQLEERVQVLEKIVTDRNFDLRQKFRDLENS